MCVRAHWSIHIISLSRPISRSTDCRDSDSDPRAAGWFRPENKINIFLFITATAEAEGGCPAHALRGGPDQGPAYNICIYIYMYIIVLLHDIIL